MKRITVFTPTYNRAYTLGKLYSSLKNQLFKDFEWLIIDDGSTDNTEELINRWIIEEKTFPIRYYKINNAGKCNAINEALDLSDGEMFFTVDSDDYLVGNTLKKIDEWERLLPSNGIFCGVAGNLGISERETPNTLFKDNCFDGTLLDRYKNVDGERAIIFYTEIHRKYKYPIFEGEKFMTEAVVWNRMANDGYKMRFYNDILCVYEYKADGLTQAGNSLFINNPQGYGLWLKERALFTKYSILERLKMYYTFTCDLSVKYDLNYISECIGVNLFIIQTMSFIHKMWRLLKRN